MTLRRNQTLYTLPVGEIRPYFSFDGVARRVSEAHVSDNPVVRHTSVANKWKTVHLLLHPGHNATQIQYNLTLQGEDDAEFTMSFAVAVDTREVPQTNASQTASKDASKEPHSTPTPEPAFPFSDVPEDKRSPKIQRRRPDEPEMAVDVPAVNVSLLPAAVRTELQKLDEKLLIGDITAKGYNLTKAELLRPYRALAGEGTAKAQGRPDEEEHKTLNKEMPRKEDQLNPVTPLISVRIDDELNRRPGGSPVAPKPHHLKAAIEKPLTSKLLSTLMSGIAKVKSAESQFEPHNAAGGAPVGRKLQHYISSDRSFLPWERRKYFQDLLLVSVTVFTHFH